jgi:hypothetical protein
MAPIETLAAARGLYCVHSSDLACWAMFEQGALVGMIWDADLVEAVDPAAFIEARIARWADEMGSLYALADEAQVASRGRRE